MMTKYWLMGVYLVAISRSPKASYRQLSIARGVMPSRAAVARSITSLAARPLFWASVFTSVSWGIRRIALSSTGAQWFRSARLSLWIVYWYCAALCAAADAHVLHGLQVEGRAGHRRKLRPEAVDDLVGRRLALRRAASGRRRRGPVLVVVPPPPPEKAMTVSTAGIGLDDLDQAHGSAAVIAWNEVSWSPRMLPLRRPVSCCGKEALGDDHVKPDVQGEGCDRNAQNEQRMLQNPAKRAP